MEDQTVVEALLHQVDEVGDVDRRRLGQTCAPSRQVSTPCEEAAVKPISLAVVGRSDLTTNDTDKLPKERP